MCATIIWSAITWKVKRLSESDTFALNSKHWRRMIQGRLKRYWQRLRHHLGRTPLDTVLGTLESPDEHRPRKTSKVNVLEFFITAKDEGRGRYFWAIT